MILVFRKGLEYKGSINGMPSDKNANIFPLMSIPLDIKGEETDLNDFQWWTYTDKWKKWLKDNPREWQAESVDYRFENAEKLIEGMVSIPNPINDYLKHQTNNIWERKAVSSFSDYVAILEAEGSGSKEVTKKFIKLGYAIEKLVNEGKFLDSLKIEDLDRGTQYAIVVDPLSEDGNPVSEGRQALRFKKIGESGGIILAEIDYSIPVGEIKTVESYMNKVAEYAKDVIIGGATLAALYGVAQVAGSMWMGWRLYKGARNIYQNFGNAQRVHNAVRSAGGVRAAAASSWNALKGFASKAFVGGRGAASVANAARVTLPSGAFVEGGLAYSTRATGNVLLKGAASQSTKAAAQRLVAQGGARAAAAVAGRAGAAAGASGLVAAEASNPIGWIIAAASVVGSGVNQIWNWMSDKQAPRYSEVDDFAYGTFTPDKIPVGKSITVCWTSDGGGGGFGFVIDLLTFGKDDTRTTMELVKLGEFDGRSLFVVLQINSKQFEKVMKDNDLMLLSFSNEDKFERGYLDNDDLEFQTIIIPDITELTIGTSFVGYSTWEEMKEAYAESPSSPIYVPSEAKNKYEFHYVNKEGKDVNVSGSLLNESEINDTYLEDLIPMSRESVEESKSNSALGYSHLINESRVLSFKDFSSSLLHEADDDNKETPDPIGSGVQNDPGERGATGSNYEEELENSIISASELTGTGYNQIPIIAYRVNIISYVNPDEIGTPDEFKYFLVGEQSIDPKNDQPVLVETASDNSLEDPRYGLMTYTPPAVEEEPEQENGEDETINIEDVDTTGKKVETTRGDVQIKSKSGSLTIKDRDVDGGINIFDEFSTEKLKRELNIDDWDSITSVKVRYDKKEEAVNVVLSNRFAPTGKRRRVVRRGEEGFQSALDFAKSVEDGISYKN